LAHFLVSTTVRSGCIFAFKLGKSILSKLRQNIVMTSYRLNRTHHLSHLHMYYAAGLSNFPPLPDGVIKRSVFQAILPRNPSHCTGAMGWKSSNNFFQTLFSQIAWSLTLIDSLILIQISGYMVNS
jgi:hypothetical protein